MPSDNLPAVDPKKVYLIAGAELNAIVDAIRTNKPRVVTHGGLEIASSDENGTFLQIAAASRLDLVVCISGVATTKTFYVAS